jgi:energy-coupling factor transporter ATP-binding protein EcfA2
MSEEKPGLTLLDDLPATTGEDRFHHEIYAGVVRDVLTSNRPGLNIGLFGKWGSGKSTIVNLLKESLPAQYETVVFNAWKTRGDTIRRQLLLAVLKVICPEEKYENIVKFTGIEVVQECVETAIKRRRRTKLALLQTCKAFFSDWSLALPTISAFLFLIVALVFALKAFGNETHENFYLTVATACFLPAFAFFLVYVIHKTRERYSFLVGNMELVSESQRLKFPEQFKKVFLENLRDYLSDSDKERLLVVVDDLDRCDPQTVVQALAAVRQLSDSRELAKLLGDESRGCQFLVPCDEEQVVLALEADDYGDEERKHGYHNYHKELLRKFFDVVVRMNDMLPDDLSNYAASLSKNVGLNEKECREIVSIAGARDPRQVKKLLNSLRLSHESIDRRAGVLLPKKNEMPRLEETELLLVALQETVCQAFKKICANPAYVEKGIPVEDNAGSSGESRREELEKANAIIASAGAVSKVTADNLIYGKLEPELREVEGGGLLQRAFADRDTTEFSEAVSALRAEDRRQVKKWLLKKARKTQSDADLRDALRLLLLYGEKDEEARKYVAECVKAAFLSTASLEEVLAGFKHFDQLELMWPLLEEAEKNAVFAAFYGNFKKDSSKANLELGFLLRHANQLPPAIAKGLRIWMAEEMKASNEDEFVSRVFGLVQDAGSRKACFGFAPDVGVLLAQKQQWLDDQDEQMKDQLSGWPRSQLIPLFIGNDNNAAWEATTVIFGQQGQLASPFQLHKAPPGVGPAWRTVDELAQIVGSEKASELFAYSKKWLNPQGEVEGAKVILDALSPMIFSLNDLELVELGDYLVKWLWGKPSELWLFDYVGKKPRGKEKTEQWTILSQRVFQQLSNNMRAPAVLNDQQKQLLIRIAKLGWSLQKDADELLGCKLKQLPPNGNTQQADAWTSCLVPLLGPERPQSSEAIRELLRNRQSINEALQAGKTVLWTKQIDSEDATVIANMCVKLSNQLPTYEDALSPLMGIKGSARIVELCVDLLNDDQNWLKGQAQLLAFVAKFSSVAEKTVQQKFQGKIKRLIISDDDATVIAGLNVLQECDKIDSVIMKEVKLRAKSENDQIRKLAETVRTKKMFN